jgi:hypothetical protein
MKAASRGLRRPTVANPTPIPSTTNVPVKFCMMVHSARRAIWRGGLVASTASALCSIPHILMAWHHMPDYAMNQYAEIIVFFLVGTVTRVLADRG